MRFSLGTALVGAVLALVVLFFAVPIAVGGSTNICQDVESHAVSNTASNIAGGNSGPVYNVINSVGQVGATGGAEQEKQAQDHPDTPTVVSCAGAFWKSL